MLVEQLLQGRQPPKQLNSFDQLEDFILDRLGFCEKIEIDRILPLKQTKRNFIRGFCWFPEFAVVSMILIILQLYIKRITSYDD
jgi:hypothetical protein